MTTQITKNSLDMMMPASDVARGPASGFSLAQVARSVARWVAELPRRRAVIQELHLLSDHELADIGLRRADIPRVFDTSFAARRTAAN